MYGILLDGVVESVFASVESLCPVFAVFAARNPAFVSLCLYHEDAVRRYYDMVDLCGVPVVLEE